MSTTSTTSLAVASSAAVWAPKDEPAAKAAGKAVTAFLDVATTSFGRATAYNTRLEQQTAELKVHDDLMGASRDVYSVLMGLDGLTDRARQVGLKKLLSTHREKDEFLTGDVEREILYMLLHELPPQRMLKLLDALRVGSEELGIKKANNARSRKLILRTLLASSRLQFWAVKYRSKVAGALTHAWGKRLTGIIRSILSKDPAARDAKENEILASNVAKYVSKDRDNDRLAAALQSVGFVLGVRDRLSLPIFTAFVAAKTDLSKGSKLPAEVLEGLRGTYHKGTPKEKVLELTKDDLTSGQKIAVQKRAKAAGVEVRLEESDLLAQDAVKLYIYAFETGMTPAIREALDKKAERAAGQFPARYESVAVIVDASGSMAGDKTQKLRPMAATLALRDMLIRTSERSLVLLAGGVEGERGLVRPSGDTSLADALVDALCTNPDTVFVLSDGYENTPAGRFAEVVDQVRELGVKTPIYHLNPVMAAEAQGVRQLAEGKVPTLPARDASSLGPGMIRGLIEADPVKGINTLIRLVLSERKALT